MSLRKQKRRLMRSTWAENVFIFGPAIRLDRKLSAIEHKWWRAAMSEGGEHE